MFFLTRRRERPLPRPAPLFGCAISPPPTALLRRRRLALAGDAHPPRPLAGPGVGLRALSADGQATAVPKAAIGADLRQPLDVLRALPAEIALDLAGLDRLAQLDDLVVGEVLDVGVGVHAHLAHDLARGRGTDAV